MGTHGMHESRCKICRAGDEKRRDVDEAFTSWRSLRDIEAESNFSKDAIARHARACGLEVRRDRNVRAALGRVIEKGMDSAEISGPALVSALVAMAKLTESGRLVDTLSIVSVDVTGLLDKMTPAELEVYAVRGELPAWTGATDDRESEG